MLTKDMILKAAKQKDLKMITELVVSDVKIVEFEDLDGLIKLKDLNLSNNQVKDVTPLLVLKELRALNLSSNLLSQLPTLTFAHLQSLNLSYNLLTNTKGLSRLKKLNYLNLSSNAIERIEELGGLTELKHLDLSSNKITKIDGLSTLLRLEELSLNYLPLAKQMTPKDFAKVTALEKLNIHHCGIKNASFLAAFPKLLVTSLKR
eukprot:TRINITY_DN4638_c0_g1_i2.p1 TRINITY_DN4638_c0_g1~~TRINITY_DN4638_c0_g1_i2.p1  ORF type:complete len:205 (-),score=37.01 TRINITY_DN4638_c0_g1_i2:554-1168(-)